MSQTAIQEIELNIKQAQELVNLNTSLQRLRNNRDFKKVFLDGFFKDEAVRLVHLKADPSMQSPEYQAAILKQMDGIGAIRGYFDMIEHQGQMAAQAIEADEEALEELRQEEAE